jgi:hypothetical protein
MPARAVEANHSTLGTAAGCPRCSGCSGCSLLIYPPTRAQCLARAGGLGGGFLDPAKLVCMGFAKNGPAGSQPRTKVQRTAAEATGSRASPNDLPCTSRLPTRLPCTPTRLPCTPTRLPCTSRLPTRLPCTPTRLPCTPTRLPCTSRLPTRLPTRLAS